MSLFPPFSEIYIIVAVFAFDFFLLVLYVNYVNLIFCPPSSVFSINIPENLIHLMVIKHKFSTFFLNIRVMEGHWGSN